MAPAVPAALSTVACLMPGTDAEARTALLFSSLSPFDDPFGADTDVLLFLCFLCVSACIPGCRRCWTSARTSGAASFSSIAGSSAQIRALEPANTSSCGTSAGQVSISLSNLFALARPKRFHT